MKHDKKMLRNTLLIVSILAAFTFLVSTTFFHLNDFMNNPMTCEYRNILPFLVVITSSLGVFVGSFVYYKISTSYQKEKKEYQKEIEVTLNFLPHSERLIVKTLIKNHGELKQSQVEKLTKISKVEIHRKINKLLEKQIIEKEQNIQGNKIKLTEKMKKIFIGPN